MRLLQSVQRRPVFVLILFIYLFIFSDRGGRIVVAEKPRLTLWTRSIAKKVEKNDLSTNTSLGKSDMPKFRIQERKLGWEIGFCVLASS